MKRFFIIMLAAAGLCACKHEISVPVDFNVLLDESNTYYAGDPVKFNLGNSVVDNLLFYSGETGSQYRFKDRYSVPMEQVKSAKMVVDYQARYGAAGALDVYVSKDFAGLTGDPDEDRRIVTEMSAAAAASADHEIEGWTRLDYEEGGSTKWTQQEYDLTPYLEGFCIAFHWHPATNSVTQRTYWVNANITVELEGLDPSVMKLTDLDLKSVMVNTEVADPYNKNNGNGTIILNRPETAMIVCQGVGADALPYAIDGWIMSTPKQLNKVANDKGTVIKTLQNYMDSFTYTYEKPGLYTATFVGINANYEFTSKDVKEVKVLVLEKPE